MMGSLTVKAIFRLLPVNTLDVLYTSVTAGGGRGYSVFGEQLQAADIMTTDVYRTRPGRYHQSELMVERCCMHVYLPLAAMLSGDVFCGSESPCSLAEGEAKLAAPYTVEPQQRDRTNLSQTASAPPQW